MSIVAWFGILVLIGAYFAGLAIAGWMLATNYRLLRRQPKVRPPRIWRVFSLFLFFLALAEGTVGVLYWTAFDRHLLGTGALAASLVFLLAAGYVDARGIERASVSTWE